VPGCSLTWEWKDTYSNYFKEEKCMNSAPVAGLDISKHFSEMCILTPDNKVFARMKVNHDVSDFNKACKLLKGAEKEFGIAPVVIMEATGHYFRLPFQFLKNAGYKVIVINPIQSNSIKNIEIRKVKNDKVDAYRIALLYRLQCLKPANMPAETICDLRNLCRQYFDFIDTRTGYINKLISIADQVFPGFYETCGKSSPKTTLEILSKYPTPDDLLSAKSKEVIEFMALVSNRGIKWATDKYAKIINVVKEAQQIYIKQSSNIILLKTTITIINELQKCLQAVEDEINKLIEGNETIGKIATLLCSIPGISTISAAAILGEVGDFSAFSKPKQLVAFFGIDPSVKDSGQFKSTQNKMSKRGSSYLRRVLFISALSSIRKKNTGEPCNPVLHELYHEKIKSKPKMVVLGSIMHKLVKIIFAVTRDGTPFELRTPKEHAERIGSKNKLHSVKAA
jgi:transposase